MEEGLAACADGEFSVFICDRADEVSREKLEVRSPGSPSEHGVEAPGLEQSGCATLPALGFDTFEKSRPGHRNPYDMSLSDMDISSKGVNVPGYEALFSDLEATLS